MKKLIIDFYNEMTTVGVSFPEYREQRRFLQRFVRKPWPVRLTVKCVLEYMKLCNCNDPRLRDLLEIMPEQYLCALSDYPTEVFDMAVICGYDSAIVDMRAFGMTVRDSRRYIDRTISGYWAEPNEADWIKMGFYAEDRDQLGLNYILYILQNRSWIYSRVERSKTSRKSRDIMLERISDDGIKKYLYQEAIFNGNIDTVRKLKYICYDKCDIIRIGGGNKSKVHMEILAMPCMMIKYMGLSAESSVEYITGTVASFERWMVELMV